MNSKSTDISNTIPLQTGHNQRCALSVINVIQNGFSLCELTWLKCILAVLFSFKILNRNRIMYGRKKRSTLTFNQFHPHIQFLQCRLPSSGSKL